MLKNIKDSLEISYKQGLESDDIIYIKGQIKDWKEMLSNIKHEQELKDNALKMYDEGQQEIERLNNIINEIEKWLESEIKRLNDIRKGKGSKIKPYGEEYNHYSTMISGYKYCLDKLQELKGDDSNGR